MKKTKTGILLLSSMICMLTASSCGKSNDISFGTGNIGGNYYAYGTVLSQLLQEDNEELAVNIKNTQGSAANIRLIQKGFLDVAIAQSDILIDAYNGSGDFASEQCKGVQALAGLYTEECQIIVNADSDIDSVSDLYGRRISVGENESGVKKNASEILFVNGLSFDVVDEVYLSFADSANALENGKIDAFFCTAGAPTTSITELAKNTDIRVLSLDERTISRMLSEYEGYTECMISAGTYQGQDEDIHTVGVKAVLIANKKLSKEKSKQILDTIFNHASELRYATRADAIDINFASSAIPVPFHSGAAEWYSEHGIDVKAAENSEAVGFASTPKQD